MVAANIASLTTKLYELLAPLDPEDRAKVVQATLILLGEPAPDSMIAAGAGAGNGGGAGAAGKLGKPTDFFDLKEPANKGEELAVAARYRELKENQHEHAKADLQKVITDARRNFDAANYSRDIKNARNQAGFFNKNTGKGQDKLSYYGQNYVDALPDREAAKQLKRPVKKKAARKKAAAKKKK